MHAGVCFAPRRLSRRALEVEATLTEPRSDAGVQATEERPLRDALCQIEPRIR